MNTLKMTKLLLMGILIKVRVGILRLLGYRIIYIQGKMTGCYHHNHMSFKRCHIKIRNNNQRIFLLNPCFNERVLWKFKEGDYSWFMRYDKILVESSSLIVSHKLLTPFNSKGCKVERDWGKKKSIPFVMLDDRYYIQEKEVK